jgi:hypothetical protein
VKKESDGEVQAIGNVTFVGARLKGGCHRLTLSSDGNRILFEGKIELEQLAGQSDIINAAPRTVTVGDIIALNAPEIQFARGCVLRGERINWELLPVPDSDKSNKLVPAVLGAPK